MFDDILAVKEFISIIRYSKEGTPITLFIEASVNKKIVYQQNTTCYIAYDASYMRFNVSIDWCVSNVVMTSLGLHGSYNTYYQRMSISNNSLIIKGDNYQIRLWENNA